jgi:hypothetical protein
LYRDDYFQFGLIFIKKVTKTGFFFKKAETKSKPVQTDQFQFGYFGEKTGSNRCLSFFRFGFFGFRLIKPKPNRTA